MLKALYDSLPSCAPVLSPARPARPPARPSSAPWPLERTPQYAVRARVAMPRRRCGTACAAAVGALRRAQPLAAPAGIKPIIGSQWNAPTRAGSGTRLLKLSLRVRDVARSGWRHQLRAAEAEASLVCTPTAHLRSACRMMPHRRAFLCVRAGDCVRVRACACACVRVLVRA